MIDIQTITGINDTDPNGQGCDQRKFLEKPSKKSHQKSNIDHTSDNHKLSKKYSPDDKKLKKRIEIIAIILFVIVAYAASWLAACLLVKAITWCFGFAFRWKIATGVWLIGLLLRWIISAGKSEK